MKPTARFTLAAALAIALSELACASATPYLDPEGPRFGGAYAGSPPAHAAERCRELRVVSFNVEYAKRVDRAIVALTNHPSLRGADILLLQEMDAESTESVARALSLNWAYVPGSLHPETHRDVGNAVLSAWPIAKSWKVLLPHRSRVLGQLRVATGVQLDIRGQPLVVYSLHLGSPLGNSPGQRKAQARVVLADIGQHEAPIVIGGDFNSGSVPALFAEAGFGWCTKGVGSTVRGFAFDHILARGMATRGAGVAREVSDASDHRPVWAILSHPGDDCLNP
jgi:endonuclease/exonuclease/phosphatase (EEP) superfamily protein YafD